MSPTLALDDFEPFFTHVHGHEPFSWQSDLLHSVWAERAWPDLIDVPTGGGKTALLDVALFVLALDAASPTERRWAPRRIAMVVDRRIVVDQTAARASRIVEALNNPTHSIVGIVADALRGLSCGGIPALSATLRGGLVRDVAWAQWPDLPVLLSSTVDQVGSRLFFRGYGVTNGMRPVHAGLLGNDTVILLDEVHLSQPFAETLRSVRDRFQEFGDDAFPNRWAVVELSATPSVPMRRSTVIDPDAPPRRPSDKLLARRFGASKPTRLRQVAPKRGADESAALAEAAIDEAEALLEQSHLRRLGIVVNRVANAHNIGRRLHELYPPHALEQHRTRVEVLTGRMRPIDRDELVSVVTSRLTADTPRDAESERMILVATQCIEAGADLDLDALITECASLDALRQRFGRVDRLGDLTRAGIRAQGVILASRADVVSGASDPVYGTALAATWAWLSARDSLDFGVRALDPPIGDELTPLLAPRASAPLLRPGDLDRWVQTQPLPSPDPDPALWLHGLNASSSELTIVWRGDLTEELLAEGRAADPPGQRARDLVSVLPPTTSESVGVPFAAVHRWLADRGVVPIADVDGAAEPEEPRTGGYRPFIVWRGENSTVLAEPADLQAGDVIVVPASYGGYTRGGWDPTCDDVVTDRAHEAQLRDRGAVALRLHPQFWPATPTPPTPNVGEDELEVAVAEWLEAIAEVDLPDRLAVAVDWLRKGDTGRRRRYNVRQASEGADSLMLVGRKPLPRNLWKDLAVGETVDSEPDTSSFTATEVSLDDHLAGVGTLAGQLARAVGLSPHLASDIELAGRLHDLGKTDNRFQLMLHGGDAISAAMAPEPLAKSPIPASDRAGRRRAAQVSGYPRGMRHELLSIAMAEDVRDLSERAYDWDLVLHLVASHHGHARPFAPAVVDPAPRIATHVVDGLRISADSGHTLAALDSGVAERFWRMVRRYGWFRLAWLEAILRLADHRCSEREQHGEEAFR